MNYSIDWDGPGERDDDGFEVCPNCMGMRTVPCHCGGDLCVCDNQGDAPCPTCHEEGEVTHERADRYYARQREFAETLERLRAERTLRDIGLTRAEIAASIAARLKAKRLFLGLSLQEIADRAGMSKSHVWELEAGRSKNPTIETAVRIAAAIGISLDYLTGLSSAEPDLHPEAMRIACEIDALLRERQGR